MKIGFILLCLICSARCESGSKEDISMWYKDMRKQGVFEGDLNSAQLEVKNSVEKLIKSSKKSQRLFDREKLLAYENILNLNDKTDSEEDDETELNEDDEDDMDNNKEEMGVSMHDNKNVEQENIKSLHIKDNDILLKSSTTIESKNNVSENRTHLKRTKVLLDEKQTSNKAKQTSKREEATVERLQPNQTKTMIEQKSVVKKISNRVPKASVRHLYKTCYSNFSSHLDIFYAYEKQHNKLFQKEEYLDNKLTQPNRFFKLLYKKHQNQMISPSPNILKMLKVSKKSKTIKICLRTSDCFKVCRYFYEFQMCIPGFNWIRNNSSKSHSYSVQWEAFPRKENSKINFNKKSFNNVQKKLQRDNVKINEKTREEKKTLDKTGKNKETFIGNKVKENSHSSGGKKQNNRMSTKTKLSSDDSENNIEKNEKKINVNKEVNSKGRNVPIQENIKEIPQEKSFNQKLKEENSVDINMINKIVDEKSNEYLIKIQSLELAVTKLEKQLITGQLRKSNDLLSLSQLQSQILHLQTELMKLNQTYIKLQQENQVLKHGQQKFFELRQQNERQLTSNFDINSKVHNQTNLIKQQQKKLIDMSYLIQNQSDFLSKLNHRQEQIEEQNRMLHQAVMNQSLFISHVLKTVHVLTNQLQEERIRENTNNLKIFPVQLIKQLESLISNRQIVKSEKIESHVKRKKKSSNITHKKPWIPVGKYSHHKPKVKLNKLKDMYFALLSKSCFLFDNINEQFMPNLPASLSQYKLRSSTSVENKNKTINKTVPRKKQEAQNSKTLPQINQSSKLKLQEPKIRETEKSTQNVKEIKEDLSVKNKKDTKVKDENSKEKNRPQTHNSDEMKPKTIPHSKKQPVEAPTGQKPTKSSETNIKNDKEAKERSQKMNNKNLELKEPLYIDTKQSGPKDCYDLYMKGNSKNGVYKIKPIAAPKMIDVFCDMKNGGWTIIQRRQGGSISFNREWHVYKKGFGGNYGEHWLGNDNIHWLTNQNHYSLRVDLTDWQKNKVTATYEYFMIDDENNGYRLHVDGYSGDSGDSLSKHNLSKFSTKDVDNDLVTKQFGGSCAKRFSGAWWYYKCYASNLNGIFYRDGLVADKKFDGIAWKSWKKANYSLMKTEMKIKPKTKIKNSNK